MARQANNKKKLSREEAQDFLNVMLTPTKTPTRSKMKDEEFLSSQDIDELYDIVREVEYLQEKKRTKENIEKYLVQITQYIRKIPVIETKTGSRRMTTPFLLKQVIFYVTVEYVRLGGFQDEVLKLFEENNAKLPRNFFTKLGITPTVYGYSQPINPCPYMGQKKEELGVAINHLVDQAGTYKLFVDIFGGSGSATTAVAPNRNAKYIYNELNFKVFSMLGIMSSETQCKRLITQIKELQEYLKGKAPYQYMSDVDFEQEFTDYLAVGNPYYNNFANIDDVRKEILNNSADSYANTADVQDFMIKFYDELKNLFNNSVPTLKHDNQVFDIGKALELFADPRLGIDTNPYIKNKGLAVFNFSMYYDLLLKLLDTGEFSFFNAYVSMNRFDMQAIRNINLERETMDNDFDSILNIEKSNIQVRFFNIYAYYHNRYTDPKKYNADIITIAIANILMETLKTNIEISDSEILRMLYGSGGSKGKGNKPWNILTTDYEALITSFHTRVKNLMVKDGSNMTSLGKLTDDYVDGKITERQFHAYAHTSEELLDGIIMDIANGVLKKKDIILYSDSPYESTEDYDDKAAGVNAFTPEDMKKLIEQLFESECRFIFSCRARHKWAIRKKAVEKGKIYATEAPEKAGANYRIGENVFLPFLDASEKYGKDLYVLLITKKDNLLDAIYDARDGSKEHTEIMITNFMIQPFSSDIYAGWNFLVYTYDDFLKTITNA